MTEQENRQQAARLIAQGIAALKAQDYRAGRELLLQARQLTPDNPDIYLWLTKTTRDPEKRKALLERVLKLDPDHAQAQKALAVLSERLAEVESEPETPASPSESEPNAEPVVVSVGAESPPEAAPDEPEPAVEPRPDAAPPPESEAEPPQPQTAASLLARMNTLSMPGTADLAPLPEEPEPAGEETRCPRCGAVMRLQTGTDAPYCVFCGYGLAGDTEIGVTAARHFPAVEWPEAQRARRCLTCETISLAPTGSTLETPCPLCQQAIFEPVEVLLPLPDTYLPFAVEEAQAAIALEDAAGGRRLFRGRVEMTRPRRVYLPVWFFDATVEVTYGEADGGAVSGIHTEQYTRVPLHSLSQVDGDLLRAASALQDAAPKRFKESAARGVFVLLPGMQLQSALGEAQALLLSNARQQAQATIAGNQTLVDAVVKDLTYQLTLLPAWINEIREGGRLRMGLVSGVTGSAAVGELVRGRRLR